MVLLKFKFELLWSTWISRSCSSTQKKIKIIIFYKALYTAKYLIISPNVCKILQKRWTGIIMEWWPSRNFFLHSPVGLELMKVKMKKTMKRPNEYEFCNLKMLSSAFSVANGCQVLKGLFWSFSCNKKSKLLPWFFSFWGKNRNEIFIPKVCR